MSEPRRMLSEVNDPEFEPISLRRSWRFFSIYRLALALLFLVTVLIFGDALSLGVQDFHLFRIVALVYFLLAVAFYVTLVKGSYPIDFQLSVHVTTDIVALTLMMFASGGQKSGIAILLLVVVAGAGLVGQGRMTLFYAALASVAVLLEESWRALTLDFDPADFVRAGITSIAFFAAAIIARLLAQRVVANELLARERGRQLDDQLRVSERIIRDMEVGVLVVDALGWTRLLNPSAQVLLGIQEMDGAQTLPDLLAERYPVWQERNNEVIEILQATSTRQLRVRYLPSGEPGGNALIFIEDMERVHFQAQQLKLAALGRLTANLAHEIRNPLAAISHAAELLAEESGVPVQQRLAYIIQGNTQRLNRLVTEVLELGRRDRVVPEVIRWHPFILGFMEEMALHDPLVEARVRTMGEAAIEFQFDRSHLHRVLWNLIDNALRYAGTEETSVGIEARVLASGQVELHVLDDGPGIDKALQGLVFEPFFTTHGTGTGLGLYIARELCEANGARLELIDEKPGAHFRITIGGSHAGKS